MGVLGAAALIAYLVQYTHLRRVEHVPFLGSRRAASLLLVLFILPVLVGLAVLELTSSDGAALVIGFACVAVWLVVFPLLVVSERRRARAEGLAVWPP